MTQRLLQHFRQCVSVTMNAAKQYVDKKVKFRALQPWEKGYIKEDIVKDGFKHIAITEV